MCPDIDCASKIINLTLTFDVSNQKCLLSNQSYLEILFQSRFLELLNYLIIKTHCVIHFALVAIRDINF